MCRDMKLKTHVMSVLCFCQHYLNVKDAVLQVDLHEMKATNVCMEGRMNTLLLIMSI